MTTINGNASYEELQKQYAQKNNMTYSEFEANLHAAGIKTTSLRQGEANFADYGNALSDDLKQQIMDSFDCEQDYQLQSMIADLYNDNRSVLQSGQFVDACKKMGLNVKIDYQKTSYISDYKAGNFDNSVGTGSIAVYTISDGMGGEIKIADANGNGALESEEIFMNQILGDINYELSVQQGTSVGQLGVASQGYANGNEEGEKKVSQSEFNAEVEKYIKTGFEEGDAVRNASFSLNVDGLNYTGYMNPEADDAEEIEKEENIKDIETEMKDIQAQLKALEEDDENAKETDDYIALENKYDSLESDLLAEYKA